MAIQRVVPIIKVTDMPVAIAFYCSILGCVREFSYAAGPDGPWYAGLVLEGHALHLSTFAGDGVTGSATYCYVDDVDALYARIVRAGFKTPGRVDSPVEDRPVDQSWGMREFYVRDPDGNTLRFGSPIAG